MKTIDELKKELIHKKVRAMVEKKPSLPHKKNRVVNTSDYYFDKTDFRIKKKENKQLDLFE